MISYFKRYFSDIYDIYKMKYKQKLTAGITLINKKYKKTNIIIFSVNQIM